MRKPEENRFLVIGRVGDASVHKAWIADTGCKRNWDLQLSVYAKDETRVQDGDLPPRIDRGTKWDSLARHFKAQPELLEKYDYIMLPDDDVLMAPSDINAVFEIAEEYNLTMAQPSLSYQSHVSHDILLHCPGLKLRYTNFIETMSACISTSYLKTLLPLFEQHYTGWGIDMIWGMLMQYPVCQVAIIDAVKMIHTRPLFTGPLYKSYPSGVIPHEEYRLIINSFENMPGARIVYGAVADNGQALNGFTAQIWNGLCLLAQAFRSRKPLRTIHRGLRSLRNAFKFARYRPAPLRPKPGAAIAMCLPHDAVPMAASNSKDASFNLSAVEKREG